MNAAAGLLKIGKPESERPFLKIAHEIATISKAILHVTIPLIVTSFACGAHYVLAPTSLGNEEFEGRPRLSSFPGLHANST